MLMIAYNCDTQYRTEQFRDLILQRITTTQMLSTGGQGNF